MKKPLTKSNKGTWTVAKSNKGTWIAVDSEGRRVAASGKSKPTISAEKFDKLCDEGSDEIDQYIDWESRKVVEPGARKTNIPAVVAKIIAAGGKLSHPAVLDAMDKASRSNNISFFVELALLLSRRERKKAAA